MRSRRARIVRFDFHRSTRLRVLQRHLLAAALSPRARAMIASYHARGYKGKVEALKIASRRSSPRRSRLVVIMLHRATRMRHGVCPPRNRDQAARLATLCRLAQGRHLHEAGPANTKRSKGDSAGGTSSLVVLVASLTPKQDIMIGEQISALTFAGANRRLWKTARRLSHKPGAVDVTAQEKEVRVR